MGILIKQVRIKGFRGLQNVEVDLEKITVLTGMNNAGKTSFLKALQIVFGNRQFISQEDFNIQNGSPDSEIIIDTLIVPVDKDDGEELDDFVEDWEILFTEDRIKYEDDEYQIVPLRTVVTFDQVRNAYKTKQYILNEWNPFEEADTGVVWYEQGYTDADEKSFRFEELPFFYMDAQRDILEDIKIKSSYLGKMISKIEYSEEDVAEIENQIQELNDSAVDKSEVLSRVKSTLKELDTAMNSSSDGIEITPFTKKIRDLNKGLSIYYSDTNEHFSMEYHGMGTRSWSSLLTLKSFITLLEHSASDDGKLCFPILAIEEPEAHLHPNAQKRLYSQLASISGQKIISTHSPYIAGCAELSEIRSFYKSDSDVVCGKIETSGLEKEDLRKIKRMVMNTRGEILFSKALVFFEGETEEQALPIFAEDYFEMSPLEMGLHFVGVGGSGNYLPFLRLAEAFNIPWFILSDAERDAKKDVKKALRKLWGLDSVELNKVPQVFMLDDGCDFEKHLLNNGYIDEIKSAFSELHSPEYLDEYIEEKHGTSEKRVKTSDMCGACNQNIYQDVIRDFSGDAGYQLGIYFCMTSQKTKFGPVIADKIIESDKIMPTIFTNLFDNIKEALSIASIDQSGDSE